MATKTAGLLPGGAEATKMAGGIRHGRKGMTEGPQKTVTPRIIGVLSGIREEVKRIELDYSLGRCNHPDRARKEIRVDLKRLMRFCDSDKQKLEVLNYTLENGFQAAMSIRNDILTVASLIDEKYNPKGHGLQNVYAVQVESALGVVSNILFVAAASLAVPKSDMIFRDPEHPNNVAYAFPICTPQDQKSIIGTLRRRNGKEWSWVPVELREFIARKAALNLMDSVDFPPPTELH